MNVKKILVFVTLVDPSNGIWMMLGAGRQWYTCNDKNQLTQPAGEAYAAIAEVDLKAGTPVSVGTPLDLDVSTNTILSHQCWMQAKHLGAQAELWLYTSAIEDPLLKKFAQSVLSDPKVMVPFYRARASESFHHKGQGELFLHSVEVAVVSVRLAKQYGLPKRTQDCVFVCGLLHDIGKILMFYNTGKDREKGVGGQHEAFSFMVLAEHLELLQSGDKVLFEAVSAALSPANRRKHFSEYIEEAVVRAADRLSAQAYELEDAFGGKPSSELLVRRHGRVIKRLGERVPTA